MKVKEVNKMTTPTLEQVIKDMETPYLQEKQSYYVNLNVSVKLDSKYKPEFLKALLDEPRIQKLILQLADGSSTDTEILSTETSLVEEWSKL